MSQGGNIIVAQIESTDVSTLKIPLYTTGPRMPSMLSETLTLAIEQQMIHEATFEIVYYN